jgi:2-dehydro-3-deoxyphosphogluconate aldolase/(4S)-4-hydroxy-2-oxoglutarate aldolase
MNIVFAINFFVSPDEENLKSWFEAGATCVGMGSKLFPNDVLANQNYNYITDKCRETLSLIRKIKK